MTKLLRDVYWRCSRCGTTNRLRTVASEYEPTMHTCGHCGEDSLVEAHDLTEAPNKFHLPKRHTEMDEQGAT